MRLITMIGALACALLLSGCGGPELSAAPTPTSSTPQASQGPEEWERVPAKDREAFLAVLATADPELVANETRRKRGLRRAVYTCRELAREKLDDTKLAIYVSQRFTGGAGEVSIAEGRRVGAAVKRYVCPALK